MPGSQDVRYGRQKGIDVRPEAVRHARLEAGLSLAQVAEGEVTRAAIHLVETGRMRPSMRTLQLIAGKTGRPISYFLSEGQGFDSQRSGRDRLERLVVTEEFSAAVRLGLQLLEQQLQQAIEADVRYFLGTSYVKLYDGKRALEQLGRARELFEDIGVPWMEAECIEQEAVALFLLEDPRALTRAVDAAQRCDDLRPPHPGLRTRINHLIGAIYVRNCDWRNAARYFEQALDASLSVRSLRQTARIYDGLSGAYQQLGRFSAALNYSQRALALYSMESDLRSLVRAENNLGCLLLRQGQTVAAASHLNRAFELCEQHGLRKGVRSYVLNSLAELHLLRGELGQAEARLHEALDVAREHDERQAQATSWQLLGRLRLRQRDRQGADTAFRNAIDLLERLELPERLRDCLIEYAEALQAQGNVERAIEHWRAAAEAGRRSTISSRESAALLDEAGA